MWLPVNVGWREQGETRISEEKQLHPLPERYLKYDDSELVHAPLPWQAAGLSYTASGYGRKIPTAHKIRHNGRLKRIYCCIFSNIGTSYILDHGEWLVLA